MAFEKDSEKEVKHKVYNDPHHPDHLRNRDKDSLDKQEEEKLEESREQTYGGDPHHPDHPRNRK